MFCRPNGTSVFVTVRLQNYDGTSTLLLEAEYTTDIPAAATLLSRHLQIRNGAVAAAANIELVRSYIESDY
jgi:hypothetical protein